jgi:PKD repeat protein
MSAIDSKARRPGRRMWGAAAAVFLLLAPAGCGLHEVDIPELEGPAELALSLRLTAVPDVITADGQSTSIITATLRGPDGRPLSGRTIFFATADAAGRFANIGDLSAEQVVTDGNGVAQVIYTAPPRTDATANQTVLVLARPVGDDAASAAYRSVRIELRSAEPRLFPQIAECGAPGAPTPPLCNAPPVCNFAVQAPAGFRVNVSILFQSTSADPDGTIVRYFWDFGNGKRADNPDPATVYFAPGNYTVTHTVTDNGGSQRACQAIIPIT